MTKTFMMMVMMLMMMMMMMMVRVTRMMMMITMPMMMLLMFGRGQMFPRPVKAASSFSAMGSLFACGRIRAYLVRGFTCSSLPA